MKHSKAPEQQFWQQVRGQLGLVEPPLAELEKRLAAADDDALSAEQIERMVNRAVAAEAKPEPVLTETLMPKVSRGRRWLLRASAVVGIPTMVLATVLWVEGRESRRTMDLVLATRIISETDQPLQDTNTALGYTRTRVDRGLMGLHALQHDPNSTLASAAAQALSELRIAYSNQSLPRQPGCVHILMEKLVEGMQDDSRSPEQRLASIADVRELTAYGIASIVHMPVPADAKLAKALTTARARVEFFLH